MRRSWMIDIGRGDGQFQYMADRAMGYVDMWEINEFWQGVIVCADGGERSG